MTGTNETATTRGIKVGVESFYVADQSDKEMSHFFFSYRIRIQNEGKIPVQLLNRHWVITDGQGRIEEVRGAGVVGQQPKLGPGESFEYESFCPMHTPTGTMKGSYEMICLTSGEKFEAEIPQFYLVEPNSYH